MELLHSLVEGASRMAGPIIIFITLLGIFALPASSESSSNLRKTCEEIKKKMKATRAKSDYLWEPNCDNLDGVYKETVSGLAVPRLRGAPRPPPPNRIIPRKPGDHRRAGPMVPLPIAYDPRDIWGKKCPSFHGIYDQESCNNCWAIATISMINHRVCMHSKGDTPQIFYSLKHMTTCNQFGCNTGYLTSALDSWQKNGVTTEACQPLPNSMLVFNQTECRIWCDDGQSILQTPRSFGGQRYEILSKKEEDIMRELYLFGPVMAGMAVSDDMKFYPGGIYKPVLEQKYAHAVVIHGWGVENGVKYWLVANSWGVNWGEQGYFKIQRGINECGIESYIHAAVPAEGMVSDSEPMHVEPQQDEKMEIDRR